jgi:hypothetical protein
MFKYIADNWKVIVSVAAGLAGVVAFGRDLAELIAGWKKLLLPARFKHAVHDRETELRGQVGPTIDRGALHDAVEESRTEVIQTGKFEARVITEVLGNIRKYYLYDGGSRLSYKEILDLLIENRAFVEFYISLFKTCGFASYIWETPAVTVETSNGPFEFVLHNSPQSSRTPDSKTYATYFNAASEPCGIVHFRNLGGDAVLVVPSPLRPKTNYSGFAEFFREAPVIQQYALWRELANQVKGCLSSHPIWVSVASGGISWLHIRIDSRPKYYRYHPYAKLSKLD